MQRKEVYSLTGLRGIAATFVMIYHFNISTLFTGASANILSYGYLMVDLFLVLSGFILTMTYGAKFERSIRIKDYFVFLVRRIARMYPLYALMTVTAGILIATAWMDRWPGPAIPMSTLINLTMFQTILHVPSLNIVGWSVSAEWVINLLFPLLALICLRRKWFWVVVIALASFCIFPILTILPALSHEPRRAGGLLDIWYYGTVFPVVRCFAGFVLGVVAFRLLQLAWIRKLISYGWVSFVLLLFILLEMSFKHADIWIVALFPFFVLSVSADDNIIARILGSKPIYKLGELSYAIYLIHYQFDSFMLFLAKKLELLGMTNITANFLSIFVFSILSVLIAGIAYCFIEKPARKLINSFVIKKSVIIEEAVMQTQLY